MTQKNVNYSGPKDIKAEYRLSNRGMKNVKEECDLGFGFDDTY